MPRNQNGTYTLPSGNPVVPGTTIDTSWANPTMADLGNEITNSLSRTGEGGMLVPFKNLDGAVGSPGITWTNESVTGFYRADANDMRVSVGAVDKFRWTSESVQLWNNVSLAWEDVSTSVNLDNYLPLVGGTMTGQVKGITPIDPEDLVRKDYVDAIEPGLQSFNTREDPDVIPQLGDYDAVIVGYDGGLTPNWDATQVQAALEEAYSDIQFLAGGIILKGIWDSLNNVPDLLTIPKINGNYWIVSVEGSTALPPYPGAVFTLPYLPNDRILYLDDGTDAGFAQIRQTAGGGDYLPLTGGTMLGQIKGVFPAPVAAADLTRKDYVDNAIASIPPPDLTDYLPLTGGTMSGQVKGITPVDDADLTRKDYVLEQIASSPSGLVSFKGRTASDVVPIYDDYQADLVSYDNSFAPTWGTNVQAALDNSYADIQFLAGAITLKGVWDASGNVPDLTTIPKITGNYWIVSIEGSTVLPLYPGAPAFVLPYLVNDRVLWIDDGVDSGFAQLRPSTSAYLQLTGGTMTGQIKGIAPVDAPDLTRKDYVDGNFLPLTGGTLTGDNVVLAIQAATSSVSYQTFNTESGAALGRLGRLETSFNQFGIESLINDLTLVAPTAVNINAPTTNVSNKLNVDNWLLMNAETSASNTILWLNDDLGVERGRLMGLVDGSVELSSVSSSIAIESTTEINLNAPETKVTGNINCTSTGTTVISSELHANDMGFWLHENGTLYLGGSVGGKIEFRPTGLNAGGGRTTILTSGAVYSEDDVTAFGGLPNEISMSDLASSAVTSGTTATGGWVKTGNIYEEWGSVSKSSGLNASVTLTTPMVDTAYTKQLTWESGGTVATFPLLSVSPLATGFSITAEATHPTANVSWYVKGFTA